MKEDLRIFAFADEASPGIDAQIAAMVRNGLQGLEIRNVDGENISGIPLDKAREVRRKLDDAGLSVWSVGSPLGKIGIGDDFTAHLESLRHTLELAHALGAENIRMFSFYLPGDKDPAAYRDEVLTRLRRMAEVCRGSGVTLCHENEKGIYGDTAAHCLDILTEVPEIAGVFDPANFIQCGQDTWQAWELLAPRIRYLHIKDALENGHVVPAGQGVGQVGRIVRDYLARGGRAVTIEPHLTEFVGLGALERAGEKSLVGSLRFDNDDAAFDAACAAFKAL